MDPVSRILVERERTPAALVPFVILAVFLHTGAGVAVYIAGRARPMRPGHLPAVAVRLIRPQLPDTTSRPRAAASAAASRPKPEARPSPPPEPDTSDDTPTRTSADAMPSTRAAATPRPQVQAPVAGVGRGLSLGEGVGGPPAIPSDFVFTYYVERMLGLIESRWYKPPAPAATKARVRFTITRGGYLEGIRVEESSGIPSYDRAALRALYAANPLPPLPHAYSAGRLTVHLTFSE